MRRPALALFLLFLLFVSFGAASAQDGVRTSLNAAVAAKELQSHFGKLAQAKETPDYGKPPVSKLFLEVFNTPALLKLGPPKAQDLNWLVEWLGVASSTYQIVLNFGALPGEQPNAAV